MFDDAGNSLVGFSNDKTTLKVYGGMIIQRYCVRALYCQRDNKLIKPIFHIVKAKGPILLGLTILRRMALFQKNLRVFIDNIDIHQIQQGNLARCAAGDHMSDKNDNEQNSVSDVEKQDPEVTEIMNVTEEWVDTDNIDSKILI